MSFISLLISLRRRCLGILYYLHLMCIHFKSNSLVEVPLSCIVNLSFSAITSIFIVVSCVVGIASISVVVKTVYQIVQFGSCGQYDFYGFKLSGIHDGQDGTNNILTFFLIIESIHYGVKYGSHGHSAWPLCHEVVISHGIFSLIFYFV
jgi:hypothetical protein